MQRSNMVVKELRETIASFSEDAVLFDNPSFDNSIIGISTEGGVVYNFDSMVEELMKDEDMTFEEAAEFIDYNTIRTIPYISIGNRPVIVYTEGI